MKKVAAPLLVLLLALLAPAVSAVPAPDRARGAFQTMKAKLPAVVDEWHKAHWVTGGHAEIRVARQVSPTKAKVTILCLRGEPGEKAPAGAEAVIVYLRYYDGSWTSTHCHISQQDQPRVRAAQLLMLAIDELGEK